MVYSSFELFEKLIVQLLWVHKVKNFFFLVGPPSLIILCPDEKTGRHEKSVFVTVINKIPIENLLII